MLCRPSRVAVLGLFGVLALATSAAAQPPVARPVDPPGTVRPIQPAAKPAEPAGTATGTTAPPAAKPLAPAAGPEKPAALSGAMPAPISPARAGTSPEPVGPTSEELGLPIYPGAKFITSYDAGLAQRFYLFGSTAAFADVVNFYKLQLKLRGELIFDVPATHTFEVGRYKDTEIAFPPGVTVKDYTWNGSDGFLNAKPGATPARFPTVIQLVPAPPGLAGRR